MDYSDKIINDLVELYREDNECFVNVSDPINIRLIVQDIVSLIRPMAIDQLKQADIIDLMTLANKALSCDTITDHAVIRSIHGFITGQHAFTLGKYKDTVAEGLGDLVTKEVVSQIFLKDMESRIGFAGLTVEKLQEFGDAIEKEIDSYGFTNVNDEMMALINKAREFEGTSGKESFTLKDTNRTDRGVMDF